MGIQRLLGATALMVALIGCGSHSAAEGQDTVPERLRSIIATTLKVDASKVTPNASFAKDLGANDISMIELVMAYEREFKIDIPDADADRFLLVRDVVRYLQQRKVLGG